MKPYCLSAEKAVRSTTLFPNQNSNLYFLTGTRVIESQRSNAGGVICMQL